VARPESSKGVLDPDCSHAVRILLRACHPKTRL
jgi:hypothetical protein